MMARFTLTRRIVFLAFVFVGVLSGLMAGSLGDALAEDAGTAKTPTKLSRLIVVVDKLSDAQPVLIAAWQVQQTPSQALEWTPLYPTPLKGGSSYSQPHMDLRLMQTDIETIEALPPIAQADITFDETYVLDLTALSTLSKLAGAPTTPSSTAAHPQAALQAQVQLIQGLCAAKWQTEQLDTWVGLAPQYLQSSVSMFALITRWDAWEENGFGLRCSHPWAG